jgi:hypothetical protein
VIAFQQFAVPNVGTCPLTGVSVPLPGMLYEEIVALFVTPGLPVSEAIRAPFGANETEKIPGSAS